jgi:hypothetical protein
VRNNDGGDHHINRPRRIGIGCQQLRASASILIDWILAAERNGWFGTPSRNTREVIVRDAADAVRRLHLMREDRSLHLTGERYPGFGRRRPEYARRATGPPSGTDPPAAAAGAASAADDEIPF